MIERIDEKHESIIKFARNVAVICGLLATTAMSGCKDVSSDNESNAQFNEEMDIKTKFFDDGSRIVTFTNNIMGYPLSKGVYAYCEGNDLLEIQFLPSRSEENYILTEHYFRSVDHSTCEDGRITGDDPMPNNTD